MLGTTGETISVTATTESGVPELLLLAVRLQLPDTDPGERRSACPSMTAIVTCSPEAMFAVPVEAVQLSHDESLATV
jgi:hypothetical protein